MFRMPRLLVCTLRYALLAPFLALTAAALRGTPPTWAGGGSDNKASNPSNWALGNITLTLAPGNSDQVVISNGSVLFDTNINYGALTFSGGNINGSSTLTIGSVASSNWSGGNMTFSSGGGVAVSSGATFGISGSSTDHDFSATALTNSGTVNWTGGRLRSGNGGTFTNNGVFNDTASSTVNNDLGGTSLVFTNGSGAQYNKSAPGTTTFSVTLNNSGAVNVSSGELYVHGGGSGSGAFTVTGTGNDILIDNGYTFGSGTSLSGLVRFGGGSITANGNVTANGLSIEGGSLQGSQTFSGGSISWTGGDWNSTGATTALANSTTLAIGNATDHDFNGRAITNNGTVNWSAGRLRSGNGGAFVNNATFNDSTATSTDINNDYGGTTSSFTNASGASFAKSGGGTTRFYNVTFNNNGAVSIHAGTLEIHGGGAMAGGASINADAGTSVVFSNDYSLADGATLAGSGTYQLTGGNLTASGNITVGTLTQTAGTLAGTQTFKNAAINWQAGNWNTSTAASTTIDNGSSLAIGTTSDHDFSGRAITNNGTVNWSAGRLRSGNGGTFVNNATFNDSTATSTDVNNDYGGTTAAFTNSAGATYAKSGAATTRFYNVAFNNSGAVNVHSGTLEIHGGGTNSSTGTISADAGANVVFSNDYTLANASALTGAGNFSLTGGTLTANGNVNVSNFTISAGTLAGTQTFNGGLSWSAGNLNSSGTTTIGGDSTLTIGSASDHDFSGRALYNSGTVNWTGGRLRSGNAGTITNVGTFVDSASSAINNDYGGTSLVFNNGTGATYRKTATGDTNFYVPLVNSGTLDLQSGNLVLNTDSTLNDGTTVTGNGALKLLNGTLTANGAMTFSQFQIAGGTVTGNHTFSGSTEWSAGNFNSGSSTTTVGSTGTMTIDGSGDHDFSAHNFSNNGTINWTAGAGRLRSGNAGQFTNNGTFNDAASNLWNNDYGGTTAQFFNGNGGNYNKTGIGTTTFNGVSFTNAGTINVQTGTLELGGGGSSPTGAHFNASSGTALRFTSGNFAVADGSGFAGAGSFVIAGGKVSIGTTVAVSDFELTGGTLDGVQTFNGGLAWTGGDMNDNGTTTVGSTGAMTIGGSADHDLSAHAFVNNGTVSWTGGRLRSGNGGTITNNGTFNDSSGSTVNNDYGGTALTFTNGSAGHYVKSGSNTTTYLVAFNNNGEVNVTGGALSLTAGGTIGTGASFHGSGQALLTSGTFTANGTIDSTSLVLNGATVAGTHSFTGSVLWNTGNFNASGTTTVASGATLNVSSSSDHDFSGHSLVNNGTLSWASGSGRLRAGNGATLVNNGTFNDNASSTINNDYGGTSLVFTNSVGATYKKLGSGNTDFLIPLDNNGTVAVSVGSVVLHAGGTFGSGATFTGVGTTQLLAGTFTANGSILTSNLVLAGGTLNGNPLLHGLLDFASGALGSGATTTVDSDGTMTVDSTADHDLAGSALVNNGVINWNGGRIRGGNASTITNNGTFIDNASSTVNSDYGGTALAFTNGTTGVYTKAGSGTTTFAVPFTNNGKLVVDAGSIVFNTTFTNNGSLIFANGGIAQFTNPISFTSSGTLAGAGTLNVSSVVAGGLVSPGKTPGQMNISGDFTLLSTSLLLIELGGTTQGTTYDFLNVGGKVTLAGNLSIQFTNGFASSVLPTNTFTILAANGTGGLTGAFANVANGQRLITTDGLGSFQVNYGAGLNSVTLTNFVAVPEPSTYALLGFGVASLAFAAWRRKRKA